MLRYFQALQRNNILQTKSYYQVTSFNIMAQQSKACASVFMALQLISQTHNTFVYA